MRRNIRARYKTARTHISIENVERIEFVDARVWYAAHLLSFHIIVVSGNRSSSLFFVGARIPLLISKFKFWIRL